MKLNAGDRFGRLTVVEDLNAKTVHVRCECGTQKTVARSDLRRTDNPIRSCGCLRREKTRERGLARVVHGHNRAHTVGRTPTYQSWRSMMARCYYERNDNFAAYGGRGIAVCDEWQTFEGFLSAMGERPEGMTLDRIDPDGPYAAWNCRWADATTQRANQRRAA